MACHVAELDDSIRDDLALHREVPLIDLWNRGVVLLIIDAFAVVSGWIEVVGPYRVRQLRAGSINQTSAIQLCDRSDPVRLVAAIASRLESGSHDDAFPSIKIQAPDVGEKSKPSANRGLCIRRPGESHAWHKVIEHVGFIRGATIGVGSPIPIRAHGVGCRVFHRGVEGRLIAMDFIPAMVDLVAETEIHGQVRSQLNIVLNERLRTLQARSELGRDTCLPAVCKAKQEVGVLQARSGYWASNAGCGVNCPLLCVLARELHRSRVGDRKRTRRKSSHANMSY